VRARSAWLWLWVAAGLLAATVPARTCDFDAAPSSRWSLAAEGGVWWLQTPCGERFYSLGVNILDGGYPDRRKDGKVYYSWQAFAPTLGDWIAETRQRLSEWGFNSAGGWSLAPQQLRLPAVINLELGRRAVHLLFAAAGELPHQRALGRPAAPALPRRLGWLRR